MTVKVLLEMKVWPSENQEQLQVQLSKTVEFKAVSKTLKTSKSDQPCMQPCILRLK